MSMMGQQALLLDGSRVITFHGQTITLSDKHFSEDEKTFTLNGRVYPDSGPNFWGSIRVSTEKHSVLDHLRVQDGKIFYDGASVEVGGKALSLYQAVCWGDLVACLGIFQVTDRKPAWWEGDKAYALVLFSPKTKTGAHELLTAAGKRAKFDLRLVDPLPPHK